MALCISPQNNAFAESRRAKIYMDKSGLLGLTNNVLDTQQRYICISRPHQFGKTMAIDMLSAYYSYGDNSSALFDDLQISKTSSYRKHLNKYDVLKIDMLALLGSVRSVDEMLDELKNRLLLSLHQHFGQVDFCDANNPILMLKEIYETTGRTFVILIDEWDLPFRLYPQDQAAQRNYLRFLLAFLKDQAYVSLAYITGVLPIKKYGTHSGLDMFMEYSMTAPGKSAPYFGFTEREVEELCKRYNMSPDDAKAWYGGYELKNYLQAGDIRYSMSNPAMVAKAISLRRFGPCCGRPCEKLKDYMQLEIAGLHDTIVKLTEGEAIPINIGTFSNDMVSFATKDDILSLLVHLGYLSYNSDDETVSIPNRAILQTYLSAMS